MNKKITAALQNPLKNIKWATAKSNVKFNYLSGINRPINPGHVTKIANSVDKMGMLAPVICAELDFITGKKQLYVIDKQHGLNACMRLGVGVPYIVIPISSKQELVEYLALLNASSKPWCMLDYVAAWSTLIPDYVSLNRYYQMYDFEMGILAAILSNDGIDTGGRSTNKLKRGEFRIKDEEANVKLLNQLTDVLKIVPRMNRYENKYLCSEYIKFVRTFKKYDHTKFLAALTKAKIQFVLATQEQGKLADMFYKLIN
jgi:hypothetical protein